eukprot:1183680-Prorocentrum_minimum.AAC.3
MGGAAGGAVGGTECCETPTLATQRGSVSLNHAVTRPGFLRRDSLAELRQLTYLLRPTYTLHKSPPGPVTYWGVND